MVDITYDPEETKELVKKDMLDRYNLVVDPKSIDFNIQRNPKRVSIVVDVEDAMHPTDPKTQESATEPAAESQEAASSAVSNETSESLTTPSEASNDANEGATDEVKPEEEPSSDSNQSSTETPANATLTDTSDTGVAETPTNVKGIF